MERIERDGSSEVLKRLVEACGSEEDALNATSYSCLTYKAVRDKWKEYEGVKEYAQRTIVQLNEGRTVVVDVKKKELLRVNDVDLSGLEHNQVLDLNDDGERWEGDALHQQPYGWGVLYDNEGEKVYEGFRIGDVSVCYGIQYYPDIHTAEYEGMICEGKRWGRGVQYDRKGHTVFDGEWMHDEPTQTTVVLSEACNTVHCSVEELVVSYDCCNGQEWTRFDPSLMPNLRNLRVGNSCFQHVFEVKLVGLHQLESVVIGKNCFIYEMTGMTIQKGAFYLKDCEKLHKLDIGRGSFVNYSVCEIANVNGLTEITMHGGNFTNTSDVILKGA